MSCHHYTDKRIKCIRNYMRNCVYKSILEKQEIIRDLANIILSYIPLDSCEKCISTISWISNSGTGVIYDDRSYTSSPHYVFMSLSNEGYEYPRYKAPKVVKRERPQIMRSAPIVSYKIARSKNEKPNNPQKKIKRLRNSRIFKKDRPLGYKQILNTFDACDYESYFELSLYCEHGFPVGKTKRCLCYDDNSDYDHDIDYRSHNDDIWDLL